MNQRPALRQIPLASVKLGPGVCAITIRHGAWDTLIRAAWERGWILLEMKNERPVRAFQKELLS